MSNLYRLLIVFLVFVNLCLCLSKALPSDNPQRRHYFVFNILLSLGLLTMMGASPAGPSVKFFYDWFPFLLLPMLHRETACLTSSMKTSTYDDVFIRYESRLFPALQNFHQKNRLSFVIFSEYLHACYLSFYVMLYGIPCYFYWIQNWSAFYAVSFGVFFLLLTTFMTHTFIPVHGPRTLSEKISDARSQGVAFRLTHKILSLGSTPGTAFPSGHTGFACVILGLTAMFDLHLFFLVLPIGVGLIISTVYGRFHYMLDLLAGIVYASVSIAVTYYLYLYKAGA